MTTPKKTLVAAYYTACNELGLTIEGRIAEQIKKVESGELNNFEMKFLNPGIRDRFFKILGREYNPKDKSAVLPPEHLMIEKSGGGIEIKTQAQFLEEMKRLIKKNENVFVPKVKIR